MMHYRVINTTVKRRKENKLHCVRLSKVRSESNLKCDYFGEIICFLWRRQSMSVVNWLELGRGVDSLNDSILMGRKVGNASG